MLTQQFERTAGLNDEHARAIARHHLLQQIDEQCGLARTGRTQHQHVGVLLAILCVERIELERFGSPIEEHKTAVPSASLSAVQRQQVGDMLGEHQPGTSASLVQLRVVSHWKIADVAVERQQFRLPADGLKPVAEQQRVHVVHHFSQFT